MDDLFSFGTPDEPANLIEASFWIFHNDNPRVYSMFDAFTRYAISRGRKRFSAKVIVERIRWETTLETTDGEWKINNNYPAYYARLWMRNNPVNEGFFAIRELRAGPVSEALAMEAA